MNCDAQINSFVNSLYELLETIFDWREENKVTFSKGFLPMKNLIKMVRIEIHGKKWN